MRQRATIGRSEVSERLDKHQDEAREKAEEAEENVEDVQTESQALVDLEGGTEEAAEEAEQCVESAQDASGSEFDGDSQELQAIHDQIHEYEEQMHERSDIAAGDAVRVADAGRQLHRDAPRSGLEQAEQALERDAESLTEYEKRAQEVREQSEQHNEDQGRRIAAARKK
jgi:hypothetical protein